MFKVRRREPEQMVETEEYTIPLSTLVEVFNLVSKPGVLKALELGHRVAEADPVNYVVEVKVSKEVAPEVVEKITERVTSQHKGKPNLKKLVQDAVNQVKGEGVVDSAQLEFGFVDSLESLGVQFDTGHEAEVSKAYYRLRNLIEGY